jgi:twitching motility protein PilT
MVERGASDLHLKSRSSPVLRIHGDLTPFLEYPPLSEDEIRGMLSEITTDEEKEHFEKDRELDFAYSLDGVGRFRINVYLQRGRIGAAIRAIPFEVPSLDKLGFPQIFKELSLKQNGLILVTGPTGCGKSTTLAAMINHINQNRKCHIITIEDPIEYIHTDKEGMVNQRELGKDTLSFANALRHALRQDPDVILVGEMRDLETISLAITAAETGHLVLSTLHTMGAVQTIDRIIDVFPSQQQQQIRTQLSMLLQGVISQVLLKRFDGKGLIPAFEIMLLTPAISNLIRENKTHQIPSVIQTSSAQGMCSLDSYLLRLYEQGLISLKEALIYATNPEMLKKSVRA